MYKRQPLESADKATAQDFLERIAAQCAPVMKANYLYVVALEVSKLDNLNATDLTKAAGVSAKQGVLGSQLQCGRGDTACAQISKWTLAAVSLRADGDDA